MSVLTQGTQLLVLSAGVITEIECITGFSPGSSPADQIEDTCLSERDSRTYKKGLKTPGQATATLNADPKNKSHVMLSQLAESDDETPLTWIVAWADGTSLPTVAAADANNAINGVVYPTDRTFFVFQGYPADFPFDFQANAVVTTSATIQRTGKGVWMPKTA